MKSLSKNNVFRFSLFIFVLLIVYAEPLYMQTKKLICNQCFPIDQAINLEEEGIRNVEQRTKEIISASIIKYNNLGKKSKYLDSVPYITHHVYFTPSENPKPLKPADILNIIKTSFDLNKFSPRWKHYIWTNNPEILPPEFAMIPNLEIRNIDEFKDHMIYKELTSLIYSTNFSKRYFAASSDVARMMIVEKLGGIYMDLDYEIYNYQTLMELIRTNNFVGGVVADFVTFFEANNSFFAAKPAHPIVFTALSFLYRNLTSKDLPNYVKFPCARSYSNIVTTLIPLTVAIYKKLDIKTDILLPYRFLFDLSEKRFVFQNTTIPQEKYGIKYLEKPIGNDRFSGSWHKTLDWDDCPCLQDFKTEQMMLLEANK